MSDYTYTIPDPRAFLHTLRSYLENAGNGDISEILINASSEITPESSYSNRWNAYWATLTIYVPVTILPMFDEKIKEVILAASNTIIPKNAGYDFYDCQVAPFLESPPEEDEPLSNNTMVGTARTYDHDGLRFRSKSEIKIYDELKKRNVLFFANATAVRGGTSRKLEPDFLICNEGRWGILEVMGEQYHPSSTAMKDHERARLFKEYGLFMIEFYDASDCYNKPGEVVEKFLNLLNRTSN